MFFLLMNVDPHQLIPFLSSISKLHSGRPTYAPSGWLVFLLCVVFPSTSTLGPRYTSIYTRCVWLVYFTDRGYLSCCCCLPNLSSAAPAFFFYNISQKARVVTGQSQTAKTNHLWLKWSGHVWHDSALVLYKVTKFVVQLGKTLTVTPSSWLDPDSSSWPHCAWDMIAWLHCVNTVKPTHIYYLFRAVS